MALRCKFNHSHPPKPLKAATKNRSRPWGPRPYHCPDCSEVAKPSAVGSNWVDYSDVTSAQKAGHPRACGLCFPTAGAEPVVAQRPTAVMGRGARAAAPPVVTVEDLARWRRQLLRIVDELDHRAMPNAGPAARITKLKNEGLIPRDTAAQMFLVTETRNAAEYEARIQTPAGSQAVRSAWAAVVEWARSKGIAPEAE